ncbi:hypothetical protein L0U85_12885 [Glycomyces sp. L485]|uniref:hypothetical protein n=1 Tax=Glycomyces sp. L485 TaxID=2909235 RepID=UPI001F4AC2A9|nr:hypothetical protein [Glycomyces sp. L485]MCH7231740.1 hypothetical protein [Glycomyces sp. L485]
MSERGAETAIRVGGAIVVAAAAVLAAAVESFLVPFHIGATAVPLAGALAFAGNWALAALAVWWVRQRWAVVLTAAAWFVVVVTFSARTDGGSLVITASPNGYALLLAGTAGVAVSLWQYFRPVRSRVPSTSLDRSKET